MEEKVKVRRKIIPIAIVAVLAVMAIGLGLLSFIKRESKQTINEKVEVADEATLRKMLLSEENLVITLTEDVEIKEVLDVKGKKTLKGDARVSMNMGVQGGKSILKTEREADLTIDGLVIDGNGVANGIVVEVDSKLTYKAGTICYAAASAITTYGKLYIDDISIEDSIHSAIVAEKRSIVEMTGGKIDGCQYAFLYVAKGANVEIKGDVEMSTSGNHAIRNDGKLTIRDGVYKDAGQYTAVNYGVMEMAYSGDEENGRIEVAGGQWGSIYNGETGTMKLADAYIHDSGTHAFKAAGGETEISNCLFEKSGNTAIQIAAGKISVKDVEVIEPKGCGIYARGNTDLTIDNFYVTDCAARGVMGVGAKITGKNITVINPGSHGISNGLFEDYTGMMELSDVTIENATNIGLYAEKADMTVTNATVTDSKNTGAYVNGTATLTLKDITITGTGKGSGIQIKEGATCKLLGESKISKTTARGVGVEGTFIMEGGSICDNDTTTNGSGAYVYPTGNFTMKGGEICNNKTTLLGGGIIVKTGGKLTIDGGKIHDNQSKGNGGGIFAEKETDVYLKSGSVTNNISLGTGDGMLSSGKVTVGKNFYMGSNDLKLGVDGQVVKVEGKLSKHSEKDPMRVTPVLSIKAGTNVVEFNNRADATAMSKAIKSGDGSFAFVQDDKYLEIEYTVADMDMAGADKVKVSSFAELKAAVEATTGKRQIILTADIAMEAMITVPGGTTVQIIDDGTQRTLSRKEGMSTVFFYTRYGTGLILEGTEKDKLVLDGTASKDVDTTKVSTLLGVSGGTELRNVTLQNNGSAAEGAGKQGTLVDTQYGNLWVYDSTFKNGQANSAGAIRVLKGKAYIENSEFVDNKALYGGGAIKVCQGAEAEIVDTKFENNTTTTSGGAIFNNGGKLTLNGITENACFINNSSKTHGGAIYANGGTYVVNGYTFTENKTNEHHGGAIFGDKSTIGVVTDSVFNNNSAASSGGAVTANGGSIDIINCELNENTATSNGGAVYVTGNGTINVAASEGATYGSFHKNKAGNGGAIFVNSGRLTVDGYAFNENTTPKNGGAIYVWDCDEVKVDNAVFTANSVANEGGAIYYTAKKSATVTNSRFYSNEALRGGAIAGRAGELQVISCELGNEGNGNTAIVSDEVADSGRGFD